MQYLVCLILECAGILQTNKTQVVASGCESAADDGWNALQHAYYI